MIVLVSRTSPILTQNIGKRIYYAAFKYMLNIELMKVKPNTVADDSVLTKTFWNSKLRNNRSIVIIQREIDW